MPTLLLHMFIDHTYRLEQNYIPTVRLVCATRSSAAAATVPQLQNYTFFVMESGDMSVSRPNTTRCRHQLQLTRAYSYTDRVKSDRAMIGANRCSVFQSTINNSAVNNKPTPTGRAASVHTARRTHQALSQYFLVASPGGTRRRRRWWPNQTSFVSPSPHQSPAAEAKPAAFETSRHCSTDRAGLSAKMKFRFRLPFYLRRRLASGEGIVSFGSHLSRCVCVRRISLGGAGNALYPVLFSFTSFIHRFWQI